MNYPFTSIWINGRFILLEDILKKNESGKTDFEVNTFEFIDEWISGKLDFTLKTSGSTGAPKDIVLTRDQMVASAILTQRALQLQSNAACLLCIDPRYIGGKMMLVRSFVIGMKLFALEPAANPLQNIPIDESINFTALVPYQVKSILGSKHPHILNNFENIIVGGAPLDEETIHHLQLYQTNFYATYGMTETVSHVALQKLNGVNKKNYFQTLQGIELRKDDRGCLAIKAPYLLGEIITNDLVELIEHDKFMWLGRWDNVINTGGVKVIPEKIEAAIEKVFLSLDLHSRFFIIGKDDSVLGQKILLVIEGESHSPEKLNQAIALLRQEVSLSYELPKEIWSSREFIQTESGKINRYRSLQLAQPFLLLKK
jgi:O-succinylbenzoic acid--CoA ligase